MDEHITTTIRQAKAAVDAADLAEPWNIVAFEVVLKTLLADSAPAPEPQRQVVPAAPVGGVDRLGLSGEAIGDLILVNRESGDLKLLLPSSAIPTAKSDATREVSLLVVSARSALGLDDDEWVDSQYVRSALDDYGRYDQSNFTGHLKRFEDEMSAVKKDGRLTFKLRRQGWERAKELWSAAARSGA